MAARIKAISQHVVASAVGESMAPLDSPTGRIYPPGTAMELRGNMEPVQSEVVGDLTCIHGSLPADLDGIFIRTGPNPHLNFYGSPYHMFSGDGMLHVTDIRSGTATYRNRWVRTKRFELESKTGKVIQMTKSFDADGVFLGTANTNIVHHDGKLMALVEVDRPYVLSMSGLETLGPNTYGGKLKHGMTAHPKVCPRTGEMMFFGYSMMQPLVHYAVVSAGGELLRSFEVPTQSGKPVMMHDMAITANHSILCEFPLCFELDRVKAGQMPYRMDYSQPSRFGILRRHAESAEEVRWFEGKAMMAFHIANAWEEGTSVKVVGCPNPAFDFSDFSSGESILYEWTFDLQSGGTTERELKPAGEAAEGSVEFPVVHPGHVGVPCRYVYTARFTKASGEEYSPIHAIRGCAKHDLRTGSVAAHLFVGGRWGGESVFVPRAGAASEDAGYLITYTFNPLDQTSELYVVDAETMGPEPLAIFRTPQRVPFGFHGLWLPRAETV